MKNPYSPIFHLRIQKIGNSTSDARRVPHEMKDSIVNLATTAKREIHATRNVGRKRKRSSAFSRVSAVRRGAALASTGTGMAAVLRW